MKVRMRVRRLKSNVGIWRMRRINKKGIMLCLRKMMRIKSVMRRIMCFMNNRTFMTKMMRDSTMGSPANPDNRSPLESINKNDINFNMIFLSLHHIEYC